jgi:hypothetical protein
MAVGSGLGIIGSKILFVGSGMSLIIWGIAGAAVGYALASSMREALVYGGTYGFALAFVFMLSGYTGADPVISKFWLFGVLGVVGAICGLAAALLGLGLKALWRKWFENRPKE